MRGEKQKVYLSLYSRLCVCVCVRACARMCARACVRVRACLRTCLYVCARVCACLCVRVCVSNIFMWAVFRLWNRAVEEFNDVSMTLCYGNGGALFFKRDVMVWLLSIQCDSQFAGDSEHCFHLHIVTEPCFTKTRGSFFHQPPKKNKATSYHYSSQLKTCAQHRKRKGSYNQSMIIMRTSMRIVEWQITEPLRSHDKITKSQK